MKQGPRYQSYCPSKIEADGAEFCRRLDKKKPGSNEQSKSLLVMNRSLPRGPIAHFVEFHLQRRIFQPVRRVLAIS